LITSLNHAAADDNVTLINGTNVPSTGNPQRMCNRAKKGATHCRPGCPALESKVESNEYFNDIWVYDVKMDRFGSVTASSTTERCLLPPRCGPYPLNNNVPQTNLRGDKLFTVGGEADVRTICGESYQHYPRLALLGTVTTVKTDDQPSWPITYKLSRSTMTFPDGNHSGYANATRLALDARFGLIVYGWELRVCLTAQLSDPRSACANAAAETAMDEQAKRVKAISPTTLVFHCKSHSWLSLVATRVSAIPCAQTATRCLVSRHSVINAGGCTIADLPASICAAGTRVTGCSTLPPTHGPSSRACRPSYLRTVASRGAARASSRTSTTQTLRTRRRQTFSWTR